MDTNELEALSHKTRWLFSHHRKVAVAITDALLTKVFQGKRDQCAEQILHVIVNAQREFWNQPDNEALLRDELKELKHLKELVEEAYGQGRDDEAAGLDLPKPKPYPARHMGQEIDARENYYTRRRP